MGRVRQTGVGRGDDKALVPTPYEVVSKSFS